MKRDQTLDPKPIAKGPSAALEAELGLEYWYMEDEAGKLAIAAEIAQLRRRAFQDPVPEEDVEWARLHRERDAWALEATRRQNAGEWAHQGYLASTGGTFEGRVSSWRSSELDHEPWYDFGGRVAGAPEGESEEETLGAALAAFGSRAGQPAPEPSEHWRAAARAVREKWTDRKARAWKGPLEPVKGSVVPPGTKERLRELRMKRAELKILPLAPGPAAAREAELARELYCTVDPAEREALLAELLELDRQAKQEPVPQEDAEWARAHREGERGLLRRIRAVRKDIAAELAYRAYCETEGIPVDERALATRLPGEFYWVGNRMIEKPEEAEQETLAAVLAVYAACTRKEPPRPSEAWLTAIRKVREVLPKPKS
ncbi:hypothetical protein [Polyangium sp. y55x31]|uniref:hypothetical protein n=1 Tax=Polyangium sp. y55x31 TaxID=3042688 RepID=UPI002482D5A2|nr:hypothetical protein [Polyangium sp. y55x31]MDI1484081.1 hypothetical protein [Polyangium sp. y55x31]